MPIDHHRNLQQACRNVSEHLEDLSDRQLEDILRWTLSLRHAARYTLQGRLPERYTPPKEAL